MFISEYLKAYFTSSPGHLYGKINIMEIFLMNSMLKISKPLINGLEIGVGKAT